MNYFYDRFSFQVPDEVYPPEADSELLADFLPSVLQPSDTVWDLGTGCGIQAIISRGYTDQVIASDINPFAGFILQENCQQNQIFPQIPFFLGAFDQPLDNKMKFSKILFNAPYLPSEISTLSHDHLDYWLEKSWNGGADGTESIQSFFNLLPSRLEPKGKAYLVYSSIPSSPDLVWSLAENQKLHPKKIQVIPYFFETVILLELSI